MTQRVIQLDGGPGRDFGIGRVIACRSESLGLELDGDIIVRLDSGEHTLKSGDDKGRYQLITAIRGGQHAELDATATTFKQKDGVPNTRFLRHAPDALEAVAQSFEGQPFILDHNAWEQRSRMGSIRSSKLHAHGGTGWSSFKMGLRVVKPEGVISVLDGTIDRFSIGWKATGPVLCTAHKVDVRSSGRCGCWPGDSVTVDGKKYVVEYEFQSSKGTEVSAVNVPAVDGTKIDDIRTALAAELNFPIPSPLPQKEEIMSLNRLAAVLGLSALTAAEEDRAVTIHETEKRSRLAAEQERDSARTEVADLKTQLAVAKVSGIKAVVDAALDAAYRDGKLRYGRDSEGKATPSVYEPMLRKLAASEGLETLKTELASMPAVVPVGQRVLNDGNDRGADKNVGAEDVGELTADERTVCQELGIDPKDYLATKKGQG